MKTRWQAYQHDGLDYHKFSIYHFGTNMQTVYIFRYENLLIDTGQGKSRQNVLAALGKKPVDTILITHHHEDHTGNAAVLQRRYQAGVYAHPHGAAILNNGLKVNPIGRFITGDVGKVPTKSIEDGEEMKVGGLQVRAIHTPGHTDDHMAYYAADRGWLFSGDLYVADKIKYFESSESLATQIASLKKLAALDFESLWCSHNPKATGGKERLLRKLQIFEDFYGTVADMYHKGMTAREIFRATGRKENTFYYAFTLGHYSALNMVHSVIRDERTGAAMAFEK